MAMLVACSQCSIKRDFGSNTVSKLLQLDFLERVISVITIIFYSKRERTTCTHLERELHAHTYLRYQNHRNVKHVRFNYIHTTNITFGDEVKPIVILSNMRLLFRSSSNHSIKAIAATYVCDRPFHTHTGKLLLRPDTTETGVLN